ncbi:MAG: hypothetical protein M3250_01550 [Thermoproteota archaeon]|jgi:hypothetical protein|nr:hypothetical protein [Thermoproteota archaeon]
MSTAAQKIINFWYRYENLNLKITFILISLQLLHLYWLTTDVVLQRIYGESFLIFPRVLLPAFVVIDYIEIPALISGITFYSLSIYKHQKDSWKNSLFLAMLAVQVVHIFWITDEVVYDAFFETRLVEFPLYIAWIAILIDYLELPVMADLFYKIIKGEKKWH